MIKKIITPYLLIFGLLLNTTATVFAAQEEQPQEKANPSTTEQIKLFLNDHKKEIIAVLGITGLALLYYKFGLTPKEEKPANQKPNNAPVHNALVHNAPVHNAPVHNAPVIVHPTIDEPEIFVQPMPGKQLTDKSYTFAFTEKTNLEFVEADITELAFSPGKSAAIVNAANTGLWAGSGVCGAIFAAAGKKELQAECYAIPKENGVYCPVGQARYTKGAAFAKKNIAVIHAVGPNSRDKWQKLLTEAYYNSLVVAEEHNITEIAFPAISTLAFGFSNTEANPVALQAVAKYFNEHPNSKIEKVIFVSFDEKDFKQYKTDVQTFRAQIKAN